MPKVLVIDDSALMRKRLSQMLEARKWQVSTARNGAQALDMVEACAPDVITLDINMPEMDGFTLIRALRALPEYRHIPILTLTTEGSAAQKQDGRAAGATGWMIKPFDPERLLATLRRLLP